MVKSNIKLVTKAHYKTDHSYYLVDPSPWPISGAVVIGLNI
jgi:hypothetical protein